MAQTKRKRRSKHRGTAAGTIEARGRTGRKPTGDEVKRREQETAKDRRLARMDRPPSWRAAANRAVIATLVFLVAVLVIFNQPVAGAAALSAFMLCFYIPLGYYTDKLMYDRRQRKKAQST